MTQEKTAIIYLGKEPPPERARNLTDWCERNEVTPLGEAQELPEVLALSYLSVEPVTMVVVEDVAHFSEDRLKAEVILHGLTEAGMRIMEVSSGMDLTDGDPRSEESATFRKIVAVMKTFRKGSYGKMLAMQRAKIRKAGGRCEGRKPFGFRPGEQETKNRMLELYQSGLGYQRIARILAAEGRSTRSGKPWSKYIVRVLLTGM